MKNLKILFFIMLFSAKVAQAQTPTKIFVDIPSANVNNFFEKTLIALVGSHYFVVSADKSSGLIQCKMAENYKRVFTNRDGIVVHYNLLLRQNENQGVRIYLQANLTEKKRGGGNNAITHHNNDLGVTHDQKYYEDIVTFLKQSVGGDQ